MDFSPAIAAVSPDRPVFVLGERAPALELVRALGATPAFYAMPGTRLLPDLVAAAGRARPTLGSLLGAGPPAGLLPARWYRDVQAAGLRHSGKARTVEFCGLSILVLCELFPAAQFVVVRQVKRAIPRSRRLPPLEPGRILEVDSAAAAAPESLSRALAFLGAPPPVELDLSDRRVGPAANPA